MPGFGNGRASEELSVGNSQIINHLETVGLTAKFFIKMFQKHHCILELKWISGIMEWDTFY